MANHSTTQVTTLLRFETRPRSFHEITADINDWLHSSAATIGVLTIFAQHTSASLVIQENADPSVQHDLLSALDRYAPETHPYRHCSEGPDDMPAHIKSMLTQTGLTIPVIDGKMDLGTWQGVYLIEHRARSHIRKIRLLFNGDFVLAD